MPSTNIESTWIPFLVTDAAVVVTPSRLIRRTRGEPRIRRFHEGGDDIGAVACAEHVVEGTRDVVDLVTVLEDDRDDLIPAFRECHRVAKEWDHADEREAEVEPTVLQARLLELLDGGGCIANVADDDQPGDDLPADAESPQQWIIVAGAIEVAQDQPVEEGLEDIGIGVSDGFLLLSVRPYRPKSTAPPLSPPESRKPAAPVCGE